MPQTPFLCALAACAAMLLANAALAAEIPATLPVERVTVYPQGAIVTRAGTVNVPAGTNRLLIAGLPTGVDTKTLHVIIDNATLRLGEIEVRRVNEADFASSAERDLRRRLDAGNDRRAAIEDTAATAQLQLKLLDSLAAKPIGDSNIDAMLGALRDGSTEARRRLRESALQLRAVDRELETVKADLAQIETKSRQSTTVLASVDAATATAAGLSVSYAVADAGWRWLYEARLDTEKRRVSLQRQGQVRQGTGEDWNNVALTLSTMAPSDDAATPTLGPLFVNLREVREFVREKASFAEADAPAPAAAQTGRALFGGVQVTATQYLAEYLIPARVTLLADREPRLYTIADDAFDVALTARVIPRADHRAHLEATFNFPDEVPLEAGELQLYRDGAYVGRAATAVILPHAEVRMPFGTDDRVRVEIHDESARSGVRGILARGQVRETRQRFDVTSFHATDINVEIIDRLPVSQNADVHVEPLSGATEPTSRGIDGNAGVLSWRFAAAPRKMISVRHYYAVAYPSDRELIERQ